MGAHAPQSAIVHGVRMQMLDSMNVAASSHDRLLHWNACFPGVHCDGSIAGFVLQYRRPVG